MKFDQLKLALKQLDFDWKPLEFDWKPLVLVPLLALLVWPFIGSSSTWLTLTVAGLADRKSVV